MNETTSQKKAKGKEHVAPRPSFWLEFQALNWTNCKKNLPKNRLVSVHELAKSGMDDVEAKEVIKTTTSFPWVIQQEWPYKREDGVVGQHFNLTQIPFDSEVDDHRFAYDYHIDIHFDIGENKWAKDAVMEKTKERLKTMNIKVGEEIAENIAIFCFHKSTIWNGAIKIHLKEPHKDGRSLLQGTRAFILTMYDNNSRRDKVCKSYGSLALNNLLLAKISSENLKNKVWFDVLEKP